MNGVQHDYYYVDGVLMYEKVGSEYEMFYRYDNDGRLSMVTCRDMTTGQKYYYNVVTNAQGDVVNLLGGSGAVRVTYTYDAYGRLVSMTDSTAGAIAIGSKNSIRYRGYVYDSETEMYYLQSRYYDPETGRFINCDAPDYIGVSDTFTSWNGFAYCENDVINRTDPNGFYSPMLAKEYADRWWYQYNPSYKSNDADCANFVSQCLYAGKLSKMTATWFNKKILWKFKISKNWGIANELYKWLISKKFIERTFVVKSEKTLNSVIKKYFLDKPQCIAVLFFDWKNDGKVDHAALSGEIVAVRSGYEMYYYAHTSMRSGQKMLYYPRKGKPYYAPVNTTLNGECVLYICLIK